MAQVTFSINMDESLKQQFDALCAGFGINSSIVFNELARKAVNERKIPFEMQPSRVTVAREKGLNAFMALRNEAKENGIQDLSLDEINEEICKARNKEEE